MPNATSSDETIVAARRALEMFAELGVAIVYGSFASGAVCEQSDLDIAVAARSPLAAEKKLEIAACVARAVGREVDLLDLRHAAGTIAQQALSEGRPLFIRDKPLYAELLKNLWYNEADMMPLYRRILAERRERFLHG